MKIDEQNVKINVYQTEIKGTGKRKRIIRK